jgi:hypothetical protein
MHIDCAWQGDKKQLKLSNNQRARNMMQTPGWIT